MRGTIIGGYNACIICVVCTTHIIHALYSPIVVGQKITGIAHKLHALYLNGKTCR